MGREGKAGGQTAGHRDWKPARTDPADQHVLPFNPAGHPGNRRDGLKVKPPSDRCIDSHDLCDAWADLGECDSNPKYMHAACRRACGDC